MAAEVVLAVDVGSSSVRASAWEAGGEADVAWESEAGGAGPGADVEELASKVERVVGRVVGALHDGARVASVVSAFPLRVGHWHAGTHTRGSNVRGHVACWRGRARTASHEAGDVRVWFASFASA